MPTETFTAQTFINKWRASTLKERSASQSHFIDLCALLGQPTPTDVDPEGTWFTFEKGASKLGGGEGWADVWRRGCFAWEYKGKHKNLDAAFKQLQLYAIALENPPLLGVSDMETIRIHTNFTNTIQEVHVINPEPPLSPERARAGDKLKAMIDAYFTENEAVDSIHVEVITVQDAVQYAVVRRVSPAGIREGRLVFLHDDRSVSWCRQLEARINQDREMVNALDPRYSTSYSSSRLAILFEESGDEGQ